MSLEIVKSQKNKMSQPCSKNSGLLLLLRLISFFPQERTKEWFVISPELTSAAAEEARGSVGLEKASQGSAAPLQVLDSSVQFLTLGRTDGQVMTKQFCLLSTVPHTQRACSYWSLAQQPGGT